MLITPEMLCEHAICRLPYKREQYIKVDPANPKIGLVTGNSVRVYAGSDYQKAMYSTTRQGMLDKNEKVTLLGEQADGYFKIAPPSFAYLWVSTQYTKAAPKIVKTTPPTTTVAPLPRCRYWQTYPTRRRSSFSPIIGIWLNWPKST